GFQLHDQLKIADAGFNSAKPPQAFCPQGCKLNEKPSIILSSTPQKFLSDYSDAAKCNKYFEQTKSSPLLFDQLNFPTLDAFADWFTSFSQGSGKEGKVLYQKCDGACSPQSKTVIAKGGGTYNTKNFIVCGPARDKSDNNYTVSVAYRWS